MAAVLGPHIVRIASIVTETTADHKSANFLFTPRRFGLYVVAAAICCAILTICLWPALHSGKAGGHCLDFNWIWLTGKRASSGAAALVYDPSSPLPPEVAALPQFQCVGTKGDGRFDYPPTILFFTYPLGFLSYLNAQAIWIAATLIVYLAALWAILQRWEAIVLALTTYPVALNILIGHNGFLTAGLFGLALAFMKCRPWISGLFLGLLSYKPQFGILFPLALLASQNWRAFLSASVATIAFAGAAALAFGPSVWPSFVMGLMEEATRLTDHTTVSNIIFPTVRGIFRDLGVGAAIAWALQATVLAVIAAAICVLWYRPVPHALKSAALCIATLASAPYALTYDYCIMPIAVAFLVQDGLTRGFFPGERTMIMTGWLAMSLFAFVGVLIVGAMTKGGGFGGQVLYFFLAVVPLIVCAVFAVILAQRARSPELGMVVAANQFAREPQRT